MTGAILRFENLSFSYTRDAMPVLEDLSLELPRGGITALLGANGAGKSTLLFLGLGWLRPRAGRILLQDRPLARYSRSETGRQMALVPQREHITFDYSVLEYVLLGRVPYLAPLSQPASADYAIAYSSLERVGLAALARRPVQTLSGGERQLALIARSLAQQPRLLLLDEPTSHLDLRNKANLVSLVRALHQDGVSIVLTTHEPELAAALATHVVLLDRGRVLCSGPVSETLTSDQLGRLYGIPIEVVEFAGRRVVLWS
jgi:iron complex transport system ATP-binding protein